ncbi:MAG TPA: sortase [Anaerolineae bacterium]|nr:sortase [Anaerolineae bacterium]HIQ05520.1 sortase [Anaerolineae bacterium]
MTTHSDENVVSMPTKRSWWAALWPWGGLLGVFVFFLGLGMAWHGFQVRIVVGLSRGAGEMPQQLVFPTAQPRENSLKTSPSPEPSPSSQASDSAVPTPQIVATPLPPAHSRPSRIVAPTVDLNAEVVEVGWVEKEEKAERVREWETASYAAGFHRGSALPGQRGNIVLSGHHNIEGAVFANLVNLQVGDYVYLYADGRFYPYRVEDKFFLREQDVDQEQRHQNAQWIAPTRDQRLTLVTCWPPTGNTYRLIVVGKPAFSVTSERYAAKQPDVPGESLWNSQS